MLFLGNIEGVKDLTPIIDVKFDKHGVKYGWAGSQAVLLADPMTIKRPEDYNAFLKDLNQYPLPDTLKGEDREVKETPAEAKAPTGFFAKLGNNIAKTAKKISSDAKDLIAVSDAKVKRQQYFLGINELCAKGLDEFINN